MEWSVIKLALNCFFSEPEGIRCLSMIFKKVDPVLAVFATEIIWSLKIEQETRYCISVFH